MTVFDTRNFAQGMDTPRIAAAIPSPAMSKLEASNAGLMEVSGSSQRKKNSKSFSINHAEVAQLVEQTIRNRQVAGSIPALGSNPSPTA